jgi:protein phosphatase
VGGASDRGRRRSNNEDSYAVLPLSTAPGGMLLAVADGLGGAEGGEVASHLAVEALAGELEQPTTGLDDPGRALRRAVDRASQAVERVGIERDDLSGLGTTLTAAFVRMPNLWLAHVGDSRAYLWRGGRLQRLTRDHTVAERMREEGLVDEEWSVRGLESMLWNALGGGSEGVQIDERQERLYPGDGLLLCSDGLTRHLSDDELERRVGRGLSAGDLCDDLVRAANRAGGEDNITVVFARVESRTLA